MAELARASSGSDADVGRGVLLPNSWCGVGRQGVGQGLEGVCVASDSGGSEARGRKRKRRQCVPLQELVKRPCKCLARSCFQQFGTADGIARIAACRDAFRARSTGEQDLFIAMSILHFNPMAQGSAAEPVAVVEASDGGDDVQCAGECIAASSDEDACKITAASDASNCSSKMPGQIAVATSEVSDYCAGRRGSQKRPRGRELLTDMKRPRKARASKGHALSCEFEGRPVCQPACIRLYGIGTGKCERIRRCERSLKDDPHSKHPVLGVSLRTTTTTKWPSVLMFLWYVYHSVAEGLPDRMVHLGELRNANGLVQRGGMEPRITVAGEGDTVDDTTAAISLHLANYAADPESLLHGPGTLKGPRRYLQHDAPIHVFWEYVAWSRRLGEEASASYPTFLRVFHKVFKTHLNFRKAKGAQHSECNICCGLKQELKQAFSHGKRTEVVERLTEHLFAQWLDRQVWWAVGLACSSWFLRRQAVGNVVAFSSMSFSVAAIIADSMDQAKFRLPRMRVLLKRLPKAFERLHRPAVKVFGVWLQGAMLDLWVSDEDVCGDSCKQIEGVARMLEKIIATYGMLPLGLHLQQDNCISECKNTHIFNFCIALVLLGVFKWATLAYLRKGHTHENVDQDRWV